MIYYVGTIALVLALLGFAIAFWRVASRAGRDTARALGADETIKAGKRIADVQSIAPRDRASLVERLRKNGGL